MYWPRPFATWYEGHASAGVTATGTRWALAEGEVGGPLGFETYILFANPGGVDAVATMTLLRVESTADHRHGRRCRPIRASRAPPASWGSPTVSSSGPSSISTQQIAVEHAMYWNGGGQFWGGGANETGIRIR